MSDEGRTDVSASHCSSGIETAFAKVPILRSKLVSLVSCA